MKNYVLNLTDGFAPLEKLGYTPLEHEIFTFPAGEPHIKIVPPNSNGKDKTIVITTKVKSSEDFMLLLLAHNALCNIGNFANLHLVMPYFPGARQDRPTSVGEPLSVDVYAQLINKLEFNSVEIFDPHSYVVTALVNNVVVHNNHKFVATCLTSKNKISSSWYKNYHLVVPDSGANKKAKDLAKYLSNLEHLDGYYIPEGGLFVEGEDNLLFCDKTRDIKTGELTGFKVYSDDLKGMGCVVVDDICDGGGTFIGLAKELKKKGAGTLVLIVTHGIFSKGVDELRKYYDRICTTDSFNVVPRVQTTEISELL